MRKLICFILFFSLLFVSAFAVEWPPENYDMPRTILTPESAEYSLSGLADSIRSMGNVGLLILGITISVSLIGTIFRWLLSIKMPKDGINRTERRQFRNEKWRSEISEMREVKIISSRSKRNW